MTTPFETDDVLAERIRKIAAEVDEYAGELLAIARILDPDSDQQPNPNPPLEGQLELEGQPVRPQPDPMEPRRWGG